MPLNQRPANGKTRIFLVDDHPVIRRAFQMLVLREPDLTVCGEADNVPEASAFPGQSDPAPSAITVEAPRPRPDFAATPVSQPDFAADSPQFDNDLASFHSVQRVDARRRR